MMRLDWLKMAITIAGTQGNIYPASLGNTRAAPWDQDVYQPWSAQKPRQHGVSNATDPKSLT